MIQTSRVLKRRLKLLKKDTQCKWAGQEDLLQYKSCRYENKIPSVTGLMATAALNAKVKEIENKIHDITNLTTKSALNTKVRKVESKKLTILIWLLRLCWQTKGIKPPTTSCISIDSKLTFIQNSKITVEFGGSCLK